MNPKSVEQKENPKQELFYRINIAIIEFLRRLGYKPNKVIDESKVDKHLTCWYLGAVVWDLYTGVEDIRTVRKAVRAKLGIYRNYSQKYKQKIYWFSDIYITRDYFEKLIGICMRGIDKERSKNV